MSDSARGDRDADATDGGRLSPPARLQWMSDDTDATPALPGRPRTLGTPGAHRKHGAVRPDALARRCDEVDAGPRAMWHAHRPPWEEDEIRRDRVEPQSVSLSWREPIPAGAPGANSTEYEIRYYEKGQSEQTYSTVKTGTPAVTVTNLKPATRYVFQIRAASPGPSWEAQSFNPSIEVQTPGEAASGSRDQSPAVVVTVVTISALLVLGSVMSVLAIWRRPCSYGKGGGDTRDEEELYFHFKVPTRRTFLDPQSCGDPLQAVHLFAKELDAKSVTLERSLGAGRFGDLCCGCLQLPGRQELPVAVHTLRDGCSDSQRLSFLAEALTLGQFDHSHIVRLEGVVTRGSPLMIVTEYMSHGALDGFLRQHEGQLVAGQLMGLLPGLASAMKYLSEMGYVHRGLAARRVLVSSGLLCKISGFGRGPRDRAEAVYTTMVSVPFPQPSLLSSCFLSSYPGVSVSLSLPLSLSLPTLSLHPVGLSKGQWAPLCGQLGLS
ncbi:Hypothetical predicted protein [Marmota monax]|uniref:Receptor protein-tyrosine kinase n=1 Tax=Marmota monax TaxID=9995 RepID=A0A5E4A5V7_MARMO|nr:Hypothetical predicted protein [Marmota monax]